MKCMDVDDLQFASLMARWCFQSCKEVGKSGGASNDAEYNGELAVQASMEPFRSKSWFNDFDKSWKKAPYFEHAEPILSRVLTAVSMARGKRFWKSIRAMRLWYIAGTRMAKYCAPGLVALLEVPGMPVFYGRDCMPLWRMIRNYTKCYYAEGVSRPVVLQKYFPYVRQYIKEVVGSKLTPEMLLHVDTGFNGSIPRAVCYAFGLTRSPANIALMSTGGSHARCLMEVGYYGSARESILKLEYRPKFFFRPKNWIGGSPLLLVTGDAPYAAAYMAGAMAFAKSDEMKEWVACCNPVTEEQRYAVVAAKDSASTAQGLYTWGVDLALAS